MSTYHRLEAFLYPHIWRADFALERDSKGKIADFRKMSFTAGLLTDVSSL